MKANQVNGSPGTPRVVGQGEEEGRARDRQLLARTCGIWRSRRVAEEERDQNQAEQRFLVDPGADVADQRRT